jgi:pimeloyl-ACP methyl ester carboxylesterase
MGREDVRFAVNGEECAGWLFRPRTGGEEVPCVVMASGLSCVREQRLDAFAQRFADAGFAALAFDYRHFGGSEGRPRQLMRAAHQRADWHAAIALARSLDGVDLRRLALWGFSLGGGHVQAVAIADPGIAAAICVAPVVDGMRTLLHIGGPGHLAGVATAGLRDGWRGLRGADPYLVPAAGPPGSGAVLARPETLAEFEAATPPGSSWRNELCARAALRPPYLLERKVRRIACPILYCIAEDDEINPPALGVAAAARAPWGELRRYPGGHFAPLLGGFEPVVADQIEFLRRTLAVAA